VRATSTALEQQVQLNSLSPSSVEVSIQVSLGGVVAGDGASIDEAIDELDSALGPYLDGQDCRIGFVLISSRSSGLGEALQLSNAIAALINDEFSELLPEPADESTPQLTSVSVGLPGTEPVGEVLLQLFLSSGCQPAG
jgi:predicted RNase H-like HicB family nuclease